MSQDSESKFSPFLSARKESASEAETAPTGGTSFLKPSRSRPTGKRRDPEFEQVTAYLRRSTHHAVKLALLKEGGNCQFSDLVESLLSQWLGQNTRGSELPNI